MLSSPLKVLKGDFQQQNTPQKQTNKPTQYQLKYQAIIESL